MLKHEEYTVGWLCCIKEEYVAAQSFLDEKHGRPEDVSPNDNNDYTLGTMGKHNVVIAVLPDGEYGIASAATVARDMLHTFPNVRIGLLVGIGGGAPSKNHDIRLGDVVVSTPRDRATGGVLHYDFTKTLQDQRVETISYLNLPPTLLRTALNGLRAEYESDGHQIQESIDQKLLEKPKLKKKYMRPDQNSDRLYRRDIIHPLSQDIVSCASVCGDNPSKLIQRPDRDDDDDNPTIHYGLIASADQLLKDAALRDKLAAENGILCFETQAAGLMNHFPCLVIRGICDYSDSHGNTSWRGYAAMTAAAYAKNLLSRVSINRVQAEKKIGEMLSGVQEGVNKLLDIQHDRHDEAILNWLTPINYAFTQMDHIARRQPGTGQWFINSAEYQAWLASDRQTLFCPGIPGSGKTIITAIVVDDIYNRFHNDTTVGIAYLYCDYRRQHEQTIEELLSSLVKQLAQRQASVPDDVRRLHEEYKKQPKPLNLDDILMLLHSTSKLFSSVIIIIDALDEARDKGCRARLIFESLRLQADDNVKIFLTSRHDAETVGLLGESLLLEIRAHAEDVQKYLLAPLLVEALSREPTVGHVETALRSLPTGLDEIYDGALMRIEDQGGGKRDLAKNILCWILHAKRPLSFKELQHAVAIRPGQSELDRKFIPTRNTIGTICAGLITIDAWSNQVRLVHYTTKEYLKRTQDIWFINHQCYILKTCLTYLSFKAFEGGCCATVTGLRDRLLLHPLYAYAAVHWGHHARKTSTYNRGIMAFLKCNAKVEASIQVLKSQWGCRNQWEMIYALLFPDASPKALKGTRMSAVHLTAYFGLDESLKHLIESNDPDKADEQKRTPLSYAAEHGYEAVLAKAGMKRVVPFLLAEDGIDIDVISVNLGQGDNSCERPVYNDCASLISHFL
ncbi:uncharacterized protein TRIREDRAFT_120927 [Trichoderma reesei QM6a]|uniref:Predicted protein n=1 Tax=Hypocrea jecorina (strain QM6a) TaxID=431241 RepID=G0REA6_HYPJQ|nr:uncharacterized protein TRIREDRAFT_120927 [Trichoderma reesei QM6a]EGR50358.1 predicted protein [Trichoderma reesei QM6a]